MPITMRPSGIPGSQSYNAPSGKYENKIYQSVSDLMRTIREETDYGTFLRKYDFGINFIPPKSQLTIGNLYSLSGSACEDFTMPEKVYKLIAILNEVNGIDLNSVIVKQVSGEESTIFSLTKFDCETLSIPFEKGLLIFPKDMKWKEYQDNSVNDNNLMKKVNLNDLSTYPKSPIDGTIRNIILKINDFYCVSENYFEISSGEIIDLENLHKRLTVISKATIPTKERSTIFDKGEVIPYAIVVDRDEYTSKRELFIELNLSKKCLYNNRTIDNKTGIMSDTLIGKSTDELFDIYIENGTKDKESYGTLNHIFDGCATLNLNFSGLTNGIRQLEYSNRFYTTPF